MLLYLDNSVLNRPFDDQRQPRIWLETLSFSLVLSLVEAGEAVILSSPVHALENERNPFPIRKKWVEKCLRFAVKLAELTPEIGQRARLLERDGFKALDALHIACAESAGADHFLTCDDRLMRRYSGKMVVQSPTMFISNQT